ncbi:aryl-alcohol oxidase, variant 3 [Coprinopsis cinerea AmutBmut pab1-1]|nr:aryl-alcohol oxidase, variant 3 [Coprinopsis cinerea AmutBmut pab1-1]
MGAKSILPFLFLLTLLPCHVYAVIREDFKDLPKLKYDFVIVGGGNAGCVMANRLSENPKFNVLLIEAGPSHEGVLDIMVPRHVSNLWGTRYDWNYTSVPQVGLNNRPGMIPRGHVLGGSTSINGMGFFRGSSDDYDRWAEVTGDPGWSWQNMLPYFLKSEKWTEPSDGHNTTGEFNPAFHSSKGRVEISLPGAQVRQMVDFKIFEAAEELGGDFAFDLDLNDGRPLGTSWLQSTIGNGTRSSSATAYLSPLDVARRNLHVLVNHRVIKVVETTRPRDRRPSFKKVAFVKDGAPEGKVQYASASKEVVLSAGALGTPQLLLLSGIGDPVDLRSVGVKPRVDLPSVGKNLTERPQVGMIWNLGISETINELANQTFIEESLEQWHTSRTGFHSAVGVNTVTSVRLPDDWAHWNEHEDPTAGENSPHFEFASFGGGIYPIPGPNLLLGPYLLSPTSRGTVKLSSSNPFDDPQVDLGLLTSTFDVLALREALNMAQKIANASTFAEWNLTLAEPWSTISAMSEEEIIETIRNIAGGAGHIVGTAAMSRVDAPYGVVNPDLTVKKVSGLRVVDASIMVSDFRPFLPVFSQVLKCALLSLISFSATPRVRSMLLQREEQI